MESGGRSGLKVRDPMKIRRQALRVCILSACIALAATAGTITQMQCAASGGGQIIQPQPCDNVQPYARAYASFTASGILDATSDASATNGFPPPGPPAFTPSSIADSNIKRSIELFFPGQSGPGTFALGFFQSYGGGRSNGGSIDGAVFGFLTIGPTTYNLKGFMNSRFSTITGPVDLGSSLVITLELHTYASAFSLGETQFSTFFFDLQSLGFADANSQAVTAEPTPEPGTIAMLGLGVVAVAIRRLRSPKTDRRLTSGEPS